MIFTLDHGFDTFDESFGKILRVDITHSPQ